MKDLTDLLPRGMSSAIARTFAMMGTCEDAILACKEAHPDRADEIHGTFGLMRPVDALAHVGGPLYECHVRELLGRVLAGVDTRPATDAEIMAAMCEATLSVPPNGQAAAAYQVLFVRLLPEMAATIDLDPLRREPWPGAAAELIEQLRRRGRQEWRTL